MIMNLRHERSWGEKRKREIMLLFEFLKLKNSCPQRN